MAQNVVALLDKAKVMNRLPSDYKLALVMGIQPTSLTNYRAGKTLPDARVISKICELTGDDPAQILVEMEAARAKTPEARALWSAVAERLADSARNGPISADKASMSDAAVSRADAGFQATKGQINTLYIVEVDPQISRRSLGPLLDL